MSECALLQGSAPVPLASALPRKLIIHLENVLNLSSGPGQMLLLTAVVLTLHGRGPVVPRALIHVQDRRCIS